MQIGSYRLISQVQAGRESVSYTAAAPSEQQVVFTDLSKGMQDPEYKPELASRLRALAMLDHPGVVPLIELGLDQQPPFLVTAFVEARALADLVAERSVPFEEGVMLARQLAQVLAAAHRLGLVHGNLNPAQVMVVDGRQVVLDFSGLESLREPVGHASFSAALDALAGDAESSNQATYDVLCLGLLIWWLATGDFHLVRGEDGTISKECLQQLRMLGEPFASGFADVLSTALAADPTARPTAQQIAESLSPDEQPFSDSASSEPLELKQTIDAGFSDSVEDPLVSEPTLQESGRAEAVAAKAAAPEQLGRFRIERKLGSGGMGTVYRAVDLTNDHIVAVKVLRTDLVRKRGSLNRFLKEARMLAELNSPHVTNLMEVNQDGDVHYIVMEYVDAVAANELTRGGTPLPEQTAVSIAADVARALTQAHEKGIIHRDVKPANILLVGGVPGAAAASDETIDEQEVADRDQNSMRPQVKLADFGLARHVAQSESMEVTRAGAVIGTPYYMSPEQCIGGQHLDARTDVYSLGATLFHFLAGRPPFLASEPMAVATLHCNEPLPKLQKLNPDVSDAVVQIVEKALAKRPEDRYHDAAAFLKDADRVLRGEPTAMVVHPQLPKSESKPAVYEFQWDLEASPAELWPHVSNTERLNQAIGLPAVEYQTRTTEAGRVERLASAQVAGMSITWQEHPFEWVEGRRFGVVREFEDGPFVWFVSLVELEQRLQGGTRLTHRLTVEPRGLVGRTIAAVEMGVRAKRSLEKVYRRIDATLSSTIPVGSGYVDPFGAGASISSAGKQRLEQTAQKLLSLGLDADTVQSLADYVRVAPDQEAARIRPLALAKALNVDPDKMVDVCLHAAREGMLVMLWDILCPSCRIASEVKDTLKAVSEHGSCEACNLDFDIDFANSIEMIFRVHSQIRDVDVKTYCIGGPAHFPHVFAQVRLSPGERIEMNLSLPAGNFRVRGPQLPYWLDVRVAATGSVSRQEISFTPGEPTQQLVPFRPGTQQLTLHNEFDQGLLVRVERTVQREDALTAARASSNALFRELYPHEVLSPGELVSVTSTVLMVTDLADSQRLYRELGDLKAFGVIHEHFRLLDSAVREHGGAMVKTIGQGLLATFPRATDAVAASLAIHQRVATSDLPSSLPLHIGIHRGTAMVATINDRLDYFGGTVNAAFDMTALSTGADVVLSPAVAEDPAVSRLLRERGVRLAVDSANDDVARWLSPDGDAQHVVLHRMIVREERDEGVGMRE